MCAIVGYIGDKQASDILIGELRRLEHRGYDSAEVAVVSQGRLRIIRCAGKISALQPVLSDEKLEGVCGVGYTRWATHGGPSENNAHPHVVNGVAVVDNGIIENYSELKKQLINVGRKFASETDLRSPLAT